MTISENDLDIYYAVGNENTFSPETVIGATSKKRNSLEWELVSTTKAVSDTTNQLSNFYLF